MRLGYVLVWLVLASGLAAAPRTCEVLEHQDPAANPGAGWFFMGEEQGDHLRVHLTTDYSTYERLMRTHQSDWLGGESQERRGAVSYQKARGWAKTFCGFWGAGEPQSTPTQPPEPTSIPFHEKREVPVSVGVYPRTPTIDDTVEVLAMVRTPGAERPAFQWTHKTSGGISERPMVRLQSGHWSSTLVWEPALRPIQSWVQVDVESPRSRGQGHLRFESEEPVAKLAQTKGAVMVLRKHPQLEGSPTRNLYAGDVVRVSGDAMTKVPGLDPSVPGYSTYATATTTRSYAYVDWPKSDSRAYLGFDGFKRQTSTWAELKIGERAKKGQGLLQEIASIAQNSIRDGGVELFFERVGARAASAASKVYAVLVLLLSPGKGGDAAASYVELRSAVVIRGDGAGGITVRSVDGVPRFVGPEGRRVDLPAGTEIRLDRGGRPGTPQGFDLARELRDLASRGIVPRKGAGPPPTPSPTAMPSPGPVPTPDPNPGPGPGPDPGPGQVQTGQLDPSVLREFEEGRAAARRGDRRTAQRKLLGAARAGHPGAFAALADLLEAEDYPAAVANRRAAARLGHQPSRAWLRKRRLDW